MSAAVPIRFTAFGEQFVYATMDELLAGADRLEHDAKILWSQRAAGNGSVGYIAARVRNQMSVIAAHFNIAKTIMELEDQKLERACAEIDKLLGDL